jgi:hypothetical protein
MSSPRHDPADDRSVPNMSVGLFRVQPGPAAGKFLRGLFPGLLWGVGEFTAVWIVEWIMKPHWEYRNAVLAIWCAVVAAPTVLYIGRILQSMWQERGTAATARGTGLRHATRR